MNKFGYRQGIISGIIISVCVVYLLRLFTYQVVSDKYKVWLKIIPSGRKPNIRHED